MNLDDVPRTLSLSQRGEKKNPSKLKTNGMSSGGQGIVNNHFGSLMLASPQKVTLTLAQAKKRSGIDVLNIPSVSGPVANV